MFITFQTKNKIVTIIIVYWITSPQTFSEANLIFKKTKFVFCCESEIPKKVITQNRRAKNVRLDPRW